MSSYITVKYEKCKMKEYITELLTMGLCDLFLQAGFVEDGEQLIGHYRTDGYRSLDSVSEITAEESLSVMIQLFRGIYQCEKHCLFENLFRLDPCRLFVNEDFSKVKTVFIPEEEEKPLTEKLADVISFLGEKGTEESAGYTERARNLILKDEYGYKAQVHHLENLRREVYLCGVK